MIVKCFRWVGRISKGDYRKNDFRSKKEMFIGSPVLEIPPPFLLFVAESDFLISLQLPVVR